MAPRRGEVFDDCPPYSPRIALVVYFYGRVLWRLGSELACDGHHRASEHVRRGIAQLCSVGRTKIYRQQERGRETVNYHLNYTA
eukprot:6190754-Pleurochrysis_carterae.AAC.3